MTDGGRGAAPASSARPPPTPRGTLPGVSGLILIGLRGSGKSTAGRHAAERLGWAFIDLDDETPRELGCATAAEALRTHGEPAFRGAERAALARQLPLDRTVLALGGGTPTAPGCARMLFDQPCPRVYLRCTAGTLRSRLAATDVSTRPSLTGRDPLDEIETLLAARDDLYRSLGDVFDVDGLDLETVVDRLVTIAQRSRGG